MPIPLHSINSASSVSTGLPVSASASAPILGAEAMKTPVSSRMREAISAADEAVETAQAFTTCPAQPTKAAALDAPVKGPKNPESSTTTKSSAPPTAQPESFDGRQVEALRAAGVPELHIQVALQRQALTHEPLTEIMRPAEYGFLSPERLAKVHAQIAHLEYFSPYDLDRINVSDLKLLSQRLKTQGLGIETMRPLLPVAWERSGEQDNGTVTLLVAEPRDGVKAHQVYPGYKHRVVVGSERSLQTLYRQHFAHSGDDAMALYGRLKTLKVDDEGADLVLRDFVLSLLRHGCYLGASDIALTPTVGSTGGGMVRYKIGGAGTVFTYLEPAIWSRVITHILNVSGASENIKKAPVDTRWEFTDADREKYQEIMHRYSFRVALLQRRASEHQGITVVMRILDQQSEASDLDALGFDEDSVESLRQAKDKATGLLLVTGPTGSGKTTTLYALLNEIDPVTRWIESIENPIEYAKGVWMQFQTRTGADEAKAAQDILKGLLRAAPDVILFGEIRKADIARELMDAANTGHLVFGTFHTNDASSTINRLKGFDVDMDMLASLLVGILAQRLIRTLCNHCKAPDTRAETVETLSNVPFLQGLLRGQSAQDKPEGRTVYRAVGCPNCNHTGYRGRRMVYELLKVTPKVQDLIEQGASPRRVVQEGIASDQTLGANALKLVALGHTSIEEAKRLAE